MGEKSWKPLAFLESEQIQRIRQLNQAMEVVFAQGRDENKNNEEENQLKGGCFSWCETVK